MKIKLIDLGRGHFNGEAKVKDLEDALNEAGKYLVSRDIEMDETKTKNLFTVYAGFHQVGQIQVIEE
jgi:predicted GNAT superfamily acetyltransferase